MRRALFWLGVLLCAVGIAGIGAGVVLSHLGLSASYNLGDPAKFQFVLVPFWLIGLVLAVLGAICVLAARLLRKAPT